jgi:hypothetical protein
LSKQLVVAAKLDPETFQQLMWVCGQKTCTQSDAVKQGIRLLAHNLSNHPEVTAETEVTA